MPGVEALERRDLLSTITVMNLAESGPGSLREAINQVNLGNFTDIEFDIPGGGFQTIAPASPLPTIVKPVTIDGTSQPGFSNNRSGGVVLSGASAGSGVSGLTLDVGSSGSVIQGLVINGFAVSGVHVISGGNVITGDYIGTDPTGTVARPNGVGILLDPGSSGNQIGDPNGGNVISGNTAEGIMMNGTPVKPTTGNVVAGNRIGTNAAGTAAVPNGHSGVLLYDADNNQIGDSPTGGTPAFLVPNVISGNVNDGVTLIGSSGNVVAGNLIGTDASGTRAVGNTISGISLGPDNSYGRPAQNNRIGNPATGSRNVISGNGGAGVYLSGVGTTGNVFQDNYIGTDVTGEAKLGNVHDGIFLIATTDNFIGTDAHGVALAAYRNVISGNGGDGVQIYGSSHIVVAGNSIGTDAAGRAPLGNAYQGVDLEMDGPLLGSTDNRIGGGDAASRNVISGNVVDGVDIRGRFNTGNVIEGNYIGTDVTGGAMLGNGSEGIYAQDAPGNVIGGDASALGLGNVISGNHDGIRLDGSSDTVVVGNFIGTDATGRVALGNAFSGVALLLDGGGNGCRNNRIGGATAAERNVISGNGTDGVYVQGPGSTGNQIQGNYIGTDVTGEAKLKNHDFGIFLVGASGNFIGTDTTGEAAPSLRNVVSGNEHDGVSVQGGSNNVIAGNYLGTDATGSKALGNGQSGLSLLPGSGATTATANNRVGGARAADRNVISGNGTQGVFVQGVATTGNVIQGDYIGTDVMGASALGNGGTGIVLSQTSLDFVGTEATGRANPAFRNVISNNALDGVVIYGSQSVVVAGNFIGTDATGKVAMGNGGSDVYVRQSVGVRIGSAIGTNDPAAGNVIAAGQQAGVTIGASTGTVVSGNAIGTSLDGTVPMGSPVGVRVMDASTVNFIGVSPGNRIANNGKAGVVVLDAGSVRNMIRGNVMTGNAGPGIDLGGDGVTPNQPGGPHAGPNQGLNHPVLTVNFNGFLAGTLNAGPNTTYIIDVYASPAGVPASRPQGGMPLGFTAVKTDAAGNAGFTFTYSPVPNMPVILATATDLSGNTSEFSGAPDPSPLKGSGRVVPFTATVPAGAVVASFTDADPRATASRLVEWINWGDGSPLARAGAVPDNGAFDIVGAHAYALPGTYPVVAVVVDPAIGVTATAVGFAQVAPVPLSIVGRGLTFKGASANFSGAVATFTDPGPAHPAGFYSAVVSWGDGTSTAASVTGGNGTFTVSASRRFVRFSGTRIAVVTVTDANRRVAQVADAVRFI